eukprot:1157630-Pelagomonas_calceolata.AAC.4
MDAVLGGAHVAVSTPTASGQVGVSESDLSHSSQLGSVELWMVFWGMHRWLCPLPLQVGR